ncbi:MAG TPA: NADH-quinone oxidoreductase subunit C [Planctomycetota bacterium]|nr:NADH-quinone oxidoreductase subunit C [Planctomycetota bacterium]
MDPLDDLAARFPDQVLGLETSAGQRFANVRRDRILELLRTLRDGHGFDMLTDLTAVDYLNQGQPERFCVVYNLYSFKTNARTRVKAFVPEGDPAIDSASPLWKAAPWAEREVYDLYGIVFRGHPDLKRILLPETYVGHPLRKDYPLTGRGERMDFPRYVP